MRESKAVPSPRKLVRGELLNMEQAAKKAGVSDTWIYNRMKDGTLPFPWYMLGPGLRRMDSADIEDWLRSCKVPAGKMPWETEGSA